MKRSKGFTLVEALVSFLLIIFLVLFVLTVFPSVQRGVSLSGNHTNASYIARSLLDDARRAGFDAIAPSTGTQTLSGVNNGQAITVSFTYSVNVQLVDTDKKQVWAVVSWVERGVTRQVTLETLITRPN